MWYVLTTYSTYVRRAQRPKNTYSMKNTLSLSYRGKIREIDSLDLAQLAWRVIFLSATSYDTTHPAPPSIDFYPLTCSNIHPNLISIPARSLWPGLPGWEPTQETQRRCTTYTTTSDQLRIRQESLTSYPPKQYINATDGEQGKVEWERLGVQRAEPPAATPFWLAQPWT